ncbi:hypothetical protein MNV84_03673 [Leishmania braziliensis]|nr:hypothetical protein MNV84_03673 [Leishmania braziliensis]
MHSAIRFSSSRSQSASSSMQTHSAAAEPLPSVSSIARGNDDCRDNPQSVLEPTVRLPTSTTSMASTFSQHSLRSGSDLPSAVRGNIPSAPLTAALSYASKGNVMGAFDRSQSGKPPAKVTSSFPGSVTSRASEASSHTKRDRSGSGRRHNSAPGAPQSRTATEPLHAHPGRFFANLPWIPPPPIYGTPLPDSSNMNRYYAHYYDPTAVRLRSPFCYPNDDVPLHSAGHHRDVGSAEWPTPSDLPLPSTFPMPPHVLPQPSLSTISASATEATAGCMAAPQHGWPMPPPLSYPPPPPPPWWFYGSPQLALSPSSSGSSSSSSKGSRYSSSSSCASARLATSPSRHPLSGVLFRQSVPAYEETAAPSRRGVSVPAGSVVTPIAAAPRRDAGGCRAEHQHPAVSSGSRCAATHTGGTGRAARQPARLFSGSSVATTRRAATRATDSAPPQGVERRVYASSSRSSDLERAANVKAVQAAPQRRSAALGIQPDQSEEYEEEVVSGNGCGSAAARMQHALSSAEAYLAKMEHLYRQLRHRYEEVVLSPEKMMRCSADITGTEGTEEKQHPRTVIATTTRATRDPQEKGRLHPLQRTLSPPTHLQPAAPMPHTAQPVSPILSAVHPPPVEVSPSLLPSSSATSATALRHELQLLESQWQRLEELKRYGGSATTTAVAPPATPSPSATAAAMDEDRFTRHRFLQLIRDRKQLLMSAA